MAKKARKYDGLVFPVVPIALQSELSESEKSTQKSIKTVYDLASSMMPDANEAAKNAVAAMLDLVDSMLPKKTDAMVNAIMDNDVSLGGLFEAKIKLQTLTALVEQNDSKVDWAILLAMRASRLVMHELYRPTEEFIGKGVAQTIRGKDMAKLKEQQKFQISKAQLLNELRKARGSNHKERCTSVGECYGVSQRTILARCSSLGIKSADYKKKF